MDVPLVVCFYQGFQRDGTGQLFGTKGQKFLHCPGTKGHKDKLKILTRDGTIIIFLSKSGTGRGTGWDNHYFFQMISCFRTSFSVLERIFPVLEHPFPVLERPFPVFCLFFWESDFVPRRSGTEEFVPGFLLLPLLVMFKTKLS